MASGTSSKDQPWKRAAPGEFRQLQRLTHRQPDPDARGQMLHEARFSEAAAPLRLYRQKEADQAIDILTDLIRVLEKELAAGPPAAGPVNPRTGGRIMDSAH